MTNFANPKPYIDRREILPDKSTFDKAKAIKEVIKIIRENKRIVEEARKSLNENPHR